MKGDDIQTTLEKEIGSMSHDRDVAIEWDGFNVVLGDNSVYYLSIEGREEKCVSECASKEECVCSRAYPNAYSFFSPKEVANFIVLNIFDKQSDYK